MLTAFFTSPFFLGLLVGFSLHLYTRGSGEVREDGAVEKASITGLKKEAFLQTQDIEKEVKKDKIEKTFVRPRFVKDELNITKRLLVVVTTEGRHIKNQENLFNWTLQPYVSDIVYLGSTSKEDEKSPKESVPDILDTLTEISSHHLSQYQLFYIIPSSAALHGRNIKKFTDPLSASDLVYAGEKNSLTGTCDLEAGILLSRDLIKQVMTQMEWCARNRVSYDQAQNLQNCVFHATQVKCQDPFEEFTYNAKEYMLSKTSFDNALLFYGAKSEDIKNTLLHELSLHNENDLITEIRHLEENIRAFINSSKYEIDINWPTGSNAKFRTTDRFDRDVSLSFNQTHQLCANDYDPASKLDTDHTKDIQEILAQCNVQPTDFKTGWKKEDATRGADYILEVGQNEKRLDSKKCLAVRELANPEIVPMPFVTESYKISLIVPVMEKDSQKTMNMLRSFAKNSIENSGHIFLMLVFIYTPERPDKNNNNDFFKDVKQLALQISKKYKKKDKVKTSSHLLWYSLQTKGAMPSNMELMDLVTHKLDDKTIILLGSPDMEIRSDYFNRARMNTILGKQVFCPIPFVEYHPAIVYGKKRPTASLNFNTSLGHFDDLNYHHLSFYKADYLHARSFTQFPIVKTESELGEKVGPTSSLPAEKDMLCSLFQHSKVHTLTAPEPSLRLRYEEIFCDEENMSEREMKSCIVRRTRSFGRRSQLAEMVMNKEEGLSEL